MRSTREGLLALSLLVVACRPAQSAGPARSARTCVPELVTERGVIWDASCAPSHLRRGTNDAVIGYFRPDAALIRALEARFRPALERGRAKPESLVQMAPDEDRVEVSWAIHGALTEILAHFPEFRCQYLGIVLVGGARRVLVNSFRGNKDEFPDWTSRWIDIEDGGAEFWRIEYDVASGRFLGFEMNPSG